MKNPYENRALSISDPTRDIVPVTPNDGADLSVFCNALYVETGGTLVLTTIGGAQRTVKVGDFSILPVSVARVWATGTTASGIHAFAN